MIIFLSAVSVRRFERLEEAIVKGDLPRIEMPEIKPFELDINELKLKEFNLKDFGELLTPEELKENYKTFVSPNKTLQMKYPVNWQEIDKVFLEEINQKMKEFNLEGNKILLFAYQVRLAKEPPVLAVLSLVHEKGLEEVIEEIKRIAEEGQKEVEVIKAETKNGKAYFEVKYKKENQVFNLKGKIVFTKERNYLIAVLTPDEFREEIAQQIDFIFDSIQVVQ